MDANSDNLIANIPGTKQDIVKQKMLLQTVISLEHLATNLTDL